MGIDGSCALMRSSTEEGPQSRLQMDSQRTSEEVRDLNLLQVIPKERIESTGRRNKMEKRWSAGILHTAAAAAADDDDDDSLLLLLLLSAMGGRQEGLQEQRDCCPSPTVSLPFAAACWATDWSVSLLLGGHCSAHWDSLWCGQKGELSSVFLASSSSSASSPPPVTTTTVKFLLGSYAVSSPSCLDHFITQLATDWSPFVSGRFG